MVTGESAPVLKEANSLVIGGTINLHGAFQIQATKVGSAAHGGNWMPRKGKKAPAATGIAITL